MDESTQLERIERLLLGIAAMLASQLESVDNDPVSRRPEVALNDAGLSLSEIAKILGRSPEAVRSTIRRTQTRGKKP